MSEQIRRGTRVKVNESSRLESMHGKRGTVVATLPDATYMVYLDELEEVVGFFRSEIDVRIEPVVKRIRTRDELLTLKAELGVGSDWHEPDNEGVTASVHGVSFDNAGFWYRDNSAGKTYEELHVVLRKDGDEVAVVNLATLFAFATGYEGEG